MNRGAEALSKLMPARGDQKKLATELEIDQGHLSRIARAEKVPGLDVRRTLRAHFDIPLEWWDEPVDTERPHQ